MPRDINITILSGTVANTPNVVTTRNNKRICLFDLLVVEKYRLADGRAAQHDNFLTVEALGKNVEKCVNEVHKGERYVIHGYLRVDDVNGIVRLAVRNRHVHRLHDGLDGADYFLFGPSTDGDDNNGNKRK